MSSAHRIRAVFLHAFAALFAVAGCDDGSSTGAGGATGSATTATGTSATATGSSNSASSSTGGPVSRVFVSSRTYLGVIGAGGLPGADAECQSMADAAGLGGTWVAWLSTWSGPNAAGRLAHATHPYVLVGGGVVAADWTDLTDKTIGVPIHNDETGAPADDAVTLVWTGTNTDGAGFSPCCTDWTESNSGSMTGLTTAVDLKWTTAGGMTCDQPGRIYCFEQ